MAAYDYAALDVQGRLRTGVIAADSSAQARGLLQKQRLVPVRLEQAAAASANHSRTRRERFASKDLVLLTRQLATLAEATPLEEALRTIGTQSDRAGVRRVVMATHGLLVEGYRLADAMARQGKAFPPLYRAMVAAGESAGALPQILERLADMLEKQQQVRARLVTTLAYPAALAVTAALVVIALMVFVVPRVVEQFDSMGRALPLLTRMVIAVSDGLVHWGPALLVLAVAAIGALVALLRRPGFRLAFDRALLRLPLLGRLLRDVHAARMSRMLATMLASGLPLMEGLSITVGTVGNRVLRAATETMATSIREGGSLTGALRRAGVFPPVMVYMATSGENSGRLPEMLDRGADYLEREFDTFTATAMSLLEPAVIVVLGGVVAMIVLSILLPILQFNTLGLA